MTPEHAAAFDSRLQETMAVYGRPRPSDFALRAWWTALEPYDWPEVDAALAGHVAECKFAPTPADVVERLTSQDDRLGPESAWSLAVQALDEGATVVWTSEIAQAFGAAKPIFDLGDEVGARKAFLEAYERAVTVARRELRPPKWEVSLGHDPQRRHDALREAERRGRLPSHTVARLLGPDAQGAAEARTGASPIAGLLEGNIAQFPTSDERDRRRYLNAVREGIAKGAAAKAAERRRIAERQSAELAEIEAKRSAIRAELARRQGAADVEHTEGAPDENASGG